MGAAGEPTRYRTVMYGAERAPNDLHQFKKDQISFFAFPATNPHPNGGGGNGGRTNRITDLGQSFVRPSEDYCAPLLGT